MQSWCGCTDGSPLPPYHMLQKPTFDNHAVQTQEQEKLSKKTVSVPKAFSEEQ